MVGLHILVLKLILIKSKTVNESGKMDHDIYGNWSLIPSWSLMKEASLGWTKMMGHALPDRADTLSAAGLEETVWSERLVAVHGSGRGNGRSHDDENAKENC